MEKREYEQYHAEWTYPSPDKIMRNSEFKMEIKFYKNDTYTFSLFKSYTVYDNCVLILLEWFNSNGVTKLILNTHHGSISIIDADSGKEIHTTHNDNVFISDYALFDNREYLYISGWLWTPVPIRSIYCIRTMLQTPDYEPTYIPCDDCYEEDSDTEESGYTYEMNPGVTLMGCKTCKEFLDNYVKIFEELGAKNL